MTKPPKETPDTTLATGPSKRQNGSQNKDSWRARGTVAHTAREGRPKAKPNLARWFWGSIILMATLSILLSVIAIYRQSADTTVELLSADTAVEISGGNVPAERSPIELSASELEFRLSATNRATAKAVKYQIRPMLEAAYQPAYRAIPKYADYHYSVWGEYAELGAAAIGDVGTKLEETLFEGLESRLKSVGNKLDQVFSSEFQTEIQKEMARIEVSGTRLGPLTEDAISNAQRRMLVTVPVGTTAIAGTKALAAIIAKKIATKLAAKAALKASGKWAAVGTTAGGAAALCSWSGPGAGLCAAAGGIGAWLVADYGIVKLDEYWNREDFESELREMIDEQKLAQQVALENAVMARALDVQEMSDAVVEQHDFTLRELAGIGNSEICRTAKELISRYDLMRGSIGERTSEGLDLLRAGVAEQAGSLSIGRLAQEITANLRDAEQVTIASLQIKGNLPQDQRADRYVSGRLVLNGNSIEIPQAISNESDGFVIVMNPKVTFTVDQPLVYAIALEQHLRIWSHAYFGGQGQARIITKLIEASGVEHRINLSVRISHDENADSLDEVRTASLAGELLSLAFRLRVKMLPALQKKPDCR